MLILKPVTGDQGRPQLHAPGESTRYDHFHFAHGFTIHTLAYMLDSLVRVSRRDKYHRWLQHLRNTVEHRRNKRLYEAK